MNFLVHNMCRLPGADGTWMLVKGGMGTITKALGEAAEKVRLLLFSLPLMLSPLPWPNVL
jgi:hypothetical protein